MTENIENVENQFSFLGAFEKEIAKISTISGEESVPTYWYSSGNYVLNKITSGSFYNCMPQGRMLALAGASGTGKSFIATNLMVNAQKEGAFNLVLDSENALDSDFVGKIGVNTSLNYRYQSVTKISDVIAIVSKFIKGYKSQYSDELATAPRVHITVDSLDMLLTDSEADNYDKGVAKGDQGQKNKQLKAMLKTFVQSIKETNITMCVTSQVYANQDLLNGQGKWIISDAVRYSMSQIILIDKLKLKDDDKVVTGIKMKCEGNKTRFTKPFQTVTIEVPYEEGMNPLSGLLETAIDMGAIKQGGAWYTLISSGEKFQRKNLKDYVEAILNDLESRDDLYLMTNVEDGELEKENVSAKKRRDEQYLEHPSVEGK